MKFFSPTSTFQPWASRSPSAATKEPDSSSAVHVLPVSLSLTQSHAGVVRPERLALVGPGEAVGADGALVGGHDERGDGVAAAAGLPDVQQGVAVRRGDLAAEAAHLDVGGVELAQPFRVAGEDVLGLRVAEQEDQGAGRRVALRGDGEVVLGRAGDLLHRGGLHGDDRVVLAAAVAVAEVRERGARGVEHREDLEGDQEERAGDQVLGGDVPAAQVEVEQAGGGGHQDAQPDPVFGLDEREGRPDRDPGHQAEQDHLDDEAGRGDRRVLPRGTGRAREPTAYGLPARGLRCRPRAGQRRAHYLI